MLGDTNEHPSPIVQAIAQAEATTTGEIRVHLSRRRWERDPLAHAARLFIRFGMTQTEARNGVLIYVNLRRRRFAVVGDVGVHEKVAPGFWRQVADHLAENLHATHPERAVAEAVVEVGRELARWFPADAHKPNRNELANEVTSF